MNKPCRTLVLGGSDGLLGRSLVEAFAKSGFEVHAVGPDDFDPTDSVELTKYIDDLQPKLVANTVAYTAVDAAEDNQDIAFLLNRTLPALLGQILPSRGISLLHYSTDFVFDGKKNTPYTEEDTPNPQSIYGESKLAGEKVLLNSEIKDLYIIRLAWLFGPHKTNFVQKILELAQTRSELNVVHDQIGSPTYSRDLAALSVPLFLSGQPGLYHLVNSGQASWCELASEAVSLAGIDCTVRPIPSEDFPQKAKRPAFSVLSTERFSQLTGQEPRPWANALSEYVYQYILGQGEED